MDTLASAMFLALCAAVISALTGYLIGHFGARSEQRYRQQSKLQNEPGALYRRRLTQLNRHAAVCRSSILVGLSCVLTGWLGNIQVQSIQAASEWLKFALVLIPIVAIGWLVVRWYQSERAIKIGHRQIEQRRKIADNLATVAGDQNRLYHDVFVSDNSPRVDHVLIGIRGAYAVCTIANNATKTGAAALEGTTLTLDERTSIDLTTLRRRVTKLQHLLSKPLGKMIRLRPVVAVSGWSINSREIDDMLIVGTRDLVMIQGWRDNSDQLLTEEAASLQADLATRARL